MIKIYGPAKYFIFILQESIAALAGKHVEKYCKWPIENIENFFY